MKISFEKPPIWKEANEMFELEKLGFEPVFTYGDTIYNPYKINISKDLVIHESTHMEQQKHNDTVAKLWWQRYLVDPEFRVGQEAEAYGRQYAFLKTIIKDRNKQAKMLWQLANFLAGNMYGRAILHGQAMKKIKAYSEKKVINSSLDFYQK